jgi:hypothetical protein
MRSGDPVGMGLENIDEQLHRSSLIVNPLQPALANIQGSKAL